MSLPKINQTGIAPVIIIIAIAVITGILLIKNQFNSPTTTPQPTMDPSFSIEASPSAEVTPTASPTASPSPTIKPTPRPTPKPTVAGTPKPTAAPAPVSNTPPGSGFSKQSVQAEIGTYTVSIVTADMNSTKVIVDTASEGTCTNNCPVLSLGEYASRNGAWAGINGSYFCPESYPQCAGKTNSFDTLLMNKNKVYFNSDNNVYSTVPLVVFQGSTARFLGQSSEWGRDTGVDAVIANHPMTLAGGNVIFGGNSDPKQGSKGNRSFVGTNGGNMVYIGVVHNVTVAESAHVLKALGLQYALNLDSGGSTALYHGGYKVGPGRNIPNALLFVNK